MRNWHVVICVLVATMSAAQDWQIFNMANAGFPSNTVQALAEDADGRIWAGTDWGLCAYHDGQWSVFQMSTYDLPANDITALAIDPDDALWIGTSLDGIVIWNVDDTTHLSTGNSLLPDNTINSITIDHRGWIWIGTPAGLACITEDGWRIYNDTPDSWMGMQMFSPHVRDVIVREDDLAAVSTMNGGLTYITDTAMVYHTSYNANFFDNSQNGIVFDSNGDRWIASLTAGLIRHAGPFNETTWFNYDVFNTGLPDNTITAIVSDENDVKYAGTEIGGFIIFQPDGSWTSFDPSDSPMPDYRVHDLMLSPDNSLWIATNEGGVVRYSLSTAIDGSANVDVSIFPSPFIDRLIISWPGASTFQWQVLDMQGRIAGTGSAQGERTVIDLRSAPAGPLHMVLTNGSTRIGQKVVKIH